MAEAQQAAECARQAASRATQTAEVAHGLASDADRAVLGASAPAQAFTQDVMAPQQQAALEAEAAVRELATRLEPNAWQLRELAELIDLRDELPHLERDKERAEAAYTAARQDTDQIVKQGTDRWSNHLLRRMQACDPETTTASIGPEDFSVPLNGSPFDARAVVGHGMTRTNVSTWLALRDPAREVPAMPVPQFLIVDSPSTGLDSSTVDQRTGTALLNSLTPDAAPASTRRGVRGQQPHPDPLTRGRRLLPDGSRALLQYLFLIWHR
ncbi:hypothetical protein [Streptomyces noursei]|uniref:hypothetical protein n=1 Tax=Streptomyces noursei TaxID=1971 RepID=UPI001963A385|nr:hypothetical protein [Streptomyces noursei]QRX94953.1 hypothetical protein JNO44_32735 [Streptomyces noursei]